MIPEKTIKELINKHSILEKDLSSGTIDKKIFAEKSKEYSDLNEIVEDAKRYITYEKDKIELEKILQDQNTDQELINMAQTELIKRAAGHLGVGAAEDLVDYFRLPKLQGKQRIQELVENNELLEVEVEGWNRPGYAKMGTKFTADKSKSVL